MNQNLVVCGEPLSVVCSESKKQKKIPAVMQLPRLRRTGADHTVLLTVAGSTPRPQSVVQDNAMLLELVKNPPPSLVMPNPELIPSEGTMMQNPLIQNTDIQNTMMENAMMENAMMQNAMMHNAMMQNPVIQNTMMQNPVMQNPVMQIPLMQNPVMQNPVMQSPVIQNTMMQSPVMQNPVMQNPVMQNPVIQSPVIQNTMMQNTMMHSPVMQNTMIQNPVMQNMIMQNPVMPNMSNVISDEVANIPNPIDDGRAINMNRVNWLSHEMLQKAAASADFWHKFIVHRGAGYSRFEVMHALFDAVEPELLTPVMYRQEDCSVTFFAQNCFLALLQLSNKQMQLQVRTSGPLGTSVQMLDIEVVIRHTPVENFRLDVHDHLLSCVARCHDAMLQTLDLSAFHQDPELSETVCWALWPPKAFTYLLKLLKPRFATIRCLCLADNEITCLPNMSILSRLEIVDLSSNKIVNMNVLKAFAGLNLLDITLDRNPVCTTFHDEQSYIQAIKDMLPGVKKIDGVHLTRPELPVWRRHYVPPGQAECVALVDQFLQHYFTLLDGEDRQRLRGMYHPDALFSLTCNYVPGQSTSSSARLTRYTLESRNLLRLSDYSKSQQLLSQGAEEVLSALCRLPRTEHDPYTFAVDLSYYTQDIAVIVVTGVFREPSMMNEHLIRAFSRTFVLSKVASKEYQIANELLMVCNASTKQAEESFRYPKPKVSLAKLSFNPAQDLTDSDRKQMTKILSRLTEMNPLWAQKCLQQSKWDIKWALMIFTELLKMNKLPAEAFVPEEDGVGEKK